MTITPAIEKGSILALHPKEEMKPKKTLIFNFDVGLKEIASTPNAAQGMKSEDQKAQRAYCECSQWFLKYGPVIFMSIAFTASIACGLNVYSAIGFSLLGFFSAITYGVIVCNNVNI